MLKTLLLVSFILLGVLSMVTRVQAQRILVGPNVRVSRSSSLPRAEMEIAANPTNAKNLIGAAIVTELDGDHCKTYASFDGGYTWRETTFAELPESGTGDPQIAFAPDGTAYFSALGEIRGPDGKKHFSVGLFRSQDGGLSWQKMTAYGAGYGPDHDQMVIDTLSRAAGRIYVSVGHYTDLNDDSNIGVFRSDDRGATVFGPLHVTSDATNGLFGLNPVVFSDGTLFVPISVSERKELADRKIPSVDIAFAFSRDGGYTFSPLTKIRTQTLDPRYDVGSPYAGVLFAVDASAKFRDRLYMVWGEAAGGHYHLQLSYSKDKGKTWSEPHEIGNPTANTNQFRPALAVNGQGIVGVSWFDTRETPGPRMYNEFFTASSDGGETFLPPARVSSQASALDAPNNLVLRPTIDSPRASGGKLGFSLMTNSAGFPDGGDYLGLTADITGAFHPLWADTRSGSFQSWTATIRIEPSGRAGNSEVAAQNSQSEVTTKFWPLFDPAHYDPKTETEEIPVRLKNTSEDSVCTPLIVHIKTGATGRLESGAQILNGTAAKSEGGIVFDYSNAMGDFSCLAPGEATEPIVWKVRPDPKDKTFASVQFTVTGSVRLKH